MIKLIRQNRGKAKTRFNILLRVLPPRYQKILLKNPVISKNSTDDRFISCIFKIEDSNIKVSHLNRPFIHPESREVSSYANIKKTYKILDWKCAYCNKSIKSKIDYFKPDNFVCVKCYKYYVKDVNRVDQVVLDSMVSFTDYCKTLLRENQKKFIKYIKKNEKTNTLL